MSSTHGEGTRMTLGASPVVSCSFPVSGDSGSGSTSFAQRVSSGMASSAPQWKDTGRRGVRCSGVFVLFLEERVPLCGVALLRAPRDAELKEHRFTERRLRRSPLETGERPPREERWQRVLIEGTFGDVAGSPTTQMEKH
mmetsp:Transcript_23886/g.62764  ORF Transcript_23886/g.62764 Transcript_23886/m.62764 type:complete len:140 (+) Transcript_23886:2657-3076(+)